MSEGAAARPRSPCHFLALVHALLGSGSVVDVQRKEELQYNMRVEQKPLVTIEDADSPCKQQTFLHTLSPRKCWRRRPTRELSSLPLCSLKQLKEDLDTIVQDASQELVALLQERQGLQEEVDIRSITIEQLLKFAEKRQLQLGEPLAIQMSVVQNRCPDTASESRLC